MRRLIYLALVIGVFLFATTSESRAEVYLGEVCWQVFDSDGQPDWIYKFGVYQKEGGHIALFGTDDFAAASHGNAEIVGDKITMTITGAGPRSGSPGEAWSDTFTAVLDLSTLNGTWNSFRMIGDTFGNVQLKHKFGIISLITCP